MIKEILIYSEPLKHNAQLYTILSILQSPRYSRKKPYLNQIYSSRSPVGSQPGGWSFVWWLGGNIREGMALIPGLILISISNLVMSMNEMFVPPMWMLHSFSSYLNASLKESYHSFSMAIFWNLKENQIQHFGCELFFMFLGLISSSQWTFMLLFLKAFQPLPPFCFI